MLDNILLAQTGSMLSNFVISNNDFLEAKERDRRDRVAMYETGWDDGRKEGLNQGLQEGLIKGREAGRKEGNRNLLFKLLSRNIKEILPQDLIDKINAIKNPEILEDLAMDSLDIHTVEEFVSILEKK